MREQAIHELKAAPESFGAILDEHKRSEYRQDDRVYAVGDLLILCEWSGDGGYSGRALTAIVDHIQAGGVYGIPEGYVVMTIVPTMARSFDDGAWTAWEER